MNPVIYERIRGITVSERKHYTTYGIVAHVPSDTDNIGSTIVAVTNVSTDAAKVDALIRRCNRLALSPVHLHDVVEDFLLG